jgi:hypothetical protein
MKKKLVYRAIAATILLTSIGLNLKSQTIFIRGQQFGTDKDEYTLNHVIDINGNVYVSGKTTGIMNGENFGKNDGFIMKIDSLGEKVWSRQFGTSEEEDTQWSAIDNKGCVYITGSTTGVLKDKNFGKEDIFIVKYTPSGEMEWSKQFGTEATDVAKGICTDKTGNIYITGMTEGKLGQSSFGKADGFIMKLDSKGTLLFTTQFGTPLDDYSYSIIEDINSDLLVCGSTWGDLAGKNKGFIDGFTGQFTNKGALVKYNQFGTDGFDIAMLVRSDNDRNIYVGGTTSGNFASQQIGDGDCFLLKIGPKGDILWNKQFGTTNNDGVRGIDIKPELTDNILVSGILNLPPGNDFIRMYSKDGVLLWERNFIAEGKKEITSGKDVNFDNRGNFYHLGLTGTNMFGKLIGEHDFYLVKLALDKSYRR